MTMACSSWLKQGAFVACLLGSTSVASNCTQAAEAKSVPDDFNKPYRYVDPSEPIAKVTVFLRIKFDGDRRGGCTGSIIAPDIILTAGHCVEDTDVTAIKRSRNLIDIKVSFGTDQRNAALGNSIKTIAARIHPLFEENPGVAEIVSFDCSAWDLAILKLAHPVPLGYQAITVDSVDQLQKILGPRVTGSHSEFYYPKEFYIAGFGKIQKNNSKKLQDDFRLKVKNSTTPLPATDSLTFVTIQKGYFVCYGDSGGPVYYAGDGLHQISINSHGLSVSRGEAACEDNAASPVLANSYDWIRKTMIELGSVAPIPERPASAEGCVTTERAQKFDGGREAVEISVKNACSQTVKCRVLGRYQHADKLYGFDDQMELAPGSEKVSRHFNVTAKDQKELLLCSKMPGE